jgi:hypothetical protein
VHKGQVWTNSQQLHFILEAWTNSTPLRVIRPKGQHLLIQREDDETAGLMLGCDRSRGYCLEMICADFLAGASLEQNEATRSELDSEL